MPGEDCATWRTIPVDGNGICLHCGKPHPNAKPLPDTARGPAASQVLIDEDVTFPDDPHPAGGLDTWDF